MSAPETTEPASIDEVLAGFVLTEEDEQTWRKALEGTWGSGRTALIAHMTERYRDCGCIPHQTTTRGIWGFYCITEDQGYCNFECPHEDDDD